MGAGFIRRWTYDPGNSVLNQIEGVDIIDRDPPQQIVGVGSGVACIVGEFENGPFNTTTQVASYTALRSIFGVFGYTYAGNVGQNPCARKRLADNAVVPEYWNGNGAVQLANKQYSSLFIVRVDTSVGAVQFTRQANLVGGSLFRYSLTNGQNIAISVDGAIPVAATFTGAVATVASAAQTYAGIVAGGTLTLGIDANPNFTVTFLGTDTTQAAVIARINQYAGFPIAAVVSGTTISLTGIQQGTGGQVRVVSGSALPAGKLNFTVATTAGTGNVANISAVSPAEINTIVHAAVATVYVEQLSTGQLRMYRVSATPATDTLKVSTATATALGFPIGITDAASTGNAGIIPAGTVVQVPSGNQYVVMQDVVVTATAIANLAASGAGPYPVEIRPMLDDGSQTTTATAGAIVQVSSTTPILLDSYAVVNPQLVNGCLSESAIDAAYTNAIAATLDSAGISRTINLLWSARQSNSVRRQLLQNVQISGDGGGVGVQGRMAIVRPPIGTLETTATSTVAEPGVGAYSYQRIIYTWPAVTTTITSIATVGLAGGTGFTADGVVTVGSDGWMASICSLLNPEENPGQETSFTGGVVGIEPGVNGGVPLKIGDYILLEASGIAAPRLDSGTMVFQSGVTSVNPALYVAEAPIHRRRMADYIEDSLAEGVQPFVKKLMTTGRQQACVGTVRGFLLGLLSPSNSNLQRIAGFYVDAKTPNLVPPGQVSPTSLGIFRMVILVTTLPSMDDIVLDCSIADNVVLTQLPAAA